MKPRKINKIVENIQKDKESICSKCGKKFAQSPYSVLCDYYLDSKPVCDECIEAK